MDKKSTDINDLLNTLNHLVRRQETLSREIEKVKSAVEEITESKEKPDIDIPPYRKVKQQQPKLEKKRPESNIIIKEESVTSNDVADGAITKFKKKVKFYLQSNLEDFIGTNLINKIGMLILIIGISIGTKFAIDKNLISPLVRLILGYALGFSLLFFSYRLKKKYRNFSAVLCSGSMAILYFMTFAGIVYFHIISLPLAFSIMVAITIFTVYQSFEYNQEVISVIGLAGAYAIPFLIGGESEDHIFLFSYIAIINFGILVVALKKYWQLLFYLAFAFTWVIYVTWWQNIDFNVVEHFKSALIFSSIFFVLFYLSFLVNKVIQKSKFSIQDILLILSNSFIFYGLNYVAFDTDLMKDYLGLFTILNSMIHTLIGIVLLRRKDGDRNLLSLIFGVAIAFLSIFIPVQFNGNWITLFWIIEGTVLFLIGRTQKAYFYEYLAYPILVFAIYSLLNDWRVAYSEFGILEYKSGYHLFFNLNFITAIIVIACLSIINYINYHPKFPFKKNFDPTFKTLIEFFITGSLIGIAYYTFRFEISIYFRQLYSDSINIPFTGENTDLLQVRNPDILMFKSIWILMYSIIYFSALTVFNILKIRNQKFGNLNLILNALLILIFLLVGLFELSELRESYMNPLYPDKFEPGIANIVIRYVIILAVFGFLFINYWLDEQAFCTKGLRMYLDIFSSITVLWILSSELINLLDLGGYKSAYKLGLSILWGSYSLILIVLGIWQKLKYLRIVAIILFGITLIKLAFYDITTMDTISKTVVFILLGVLLLIISFLYNKYRKYIF